MSVSHANVTLHQRFCEFAAPTPFASALSSAILDDYRSLAKTAGPVLFNAYGRDSVRRHPLNIMDHTTAIQQSGQPGPYPAQSRSVEIRGRPGPEVSGRETSSSGDGARYQPERHGKHNKRVDNCVNRAKVYVSPLKTSSRQK